MNFHRIIHEVLLIAQELLWHGELQNFTKLIIWRSDSYESFTNSRKIIELYYNKIRNNEIKKGKISDEKILKEYQSY